MKTNTISINIELAKEWYNSNNAKLKELALQAFKEEDLQFSFRDIRSFEDACNALNLDYDKVFQLYTIIAMTSKASAAMYQLNIIRKALNLGYNLHFKRGDIYVPFNPIVGQTSDFFDEELKDYKIACVGTIHLNDTTYNILGGSAKENHGIGLGDFNPDIQASGGLESYGFLGCATKEIAAHFSLYFGYTITVAKYGDLCQ